MSFIGINPETDPVSDHETFLIGCDNGDLYLLPLKESAPTAQFYEQGVRERAKQYLSLVESTRHLTA